MRYYVAAVEVVEDGTFGMVFPDLPGCTSAADTMAECVPMAREAAEGWAESMQAAGQPIPEPSPMERFIGNPEWADFAAFVVVPVEVAEPSVRVNFTIAPGLLRRIDAAAKARGMARSAFLAEGARRLLDDDDGQRVA